MSAGARRNQPCYCGSGKKLKLCHLVEHGGPVRDSAPVVPMAPEQRLEGPAIIMCMPTRGRPTVETMSSLGSVDGIVSAFMWCPRKGVVEARNKLAKDAITLRNNESLIPSGGWYVLWFDDDAFWVPGTFRRMIAGLQQHPEIDVLAGWFCGRAAMSRPKAAKLDGNPPCMDDYYNGRIVEVATCGFHFVMHRSELLEKLPADPFTPAGTSALGEDIAFCHRVREAGFRIFVHCGVPVAHIDDDGTAYLPGEAPHRVIGGELLRIQSERDYGDLEDAVTKEPPKSAILLV